MTLSCDWIKQEKAVDMARGVSTLNSHKECGLQTLPLGEGQGELFGFQPLAHVFSCICASSKWWLV